MAIARDATSFVQNSGTSATVAHTCTGTNLILMVNAVNTSGNFSFTGMTYNGVSMTLVSSIFNATTGYYVSLWYLINPSTGTHNIVATTSGNNSVSIGGISYTGAKQSSQPDSFSSTSQTASTSATYNTTVVANNSWLIMSGGADANATSWTAGTNTNLIQNTANGVLIMDAIASVGTGSQGLTFNYSGLHTTNAVIASIAPAPTTQNLTLSVATAVYSIAGQTVTISKFKQLVLNIATAVYNFTGFNIGATFSGLINQTKPSTSWTNQNKPTTNWTNQAKNT